MKKLLHSILGVPLAHYVYYNLKHTKHENINHKLINEGNFFVTTHPYTGWVVTAYGVKFHPWSPLLYHTFHHYFPSQFHHKQNTHSFQKPFKLTWD